MLRLLPRFVYPCTLPFWETESLGASQLHSSGIALCLQIWICQGVRCLKSWISWSWVTTFQPLTPRGWVYSKLVSRKHMLTHIWSTHGTIMGVTFEIVSAIDLHVPRTPESPVYIRVHVTVDKTCVYNSQAQICRKEDLITGKCFLAPTNQAYGCTFQ